LSETTNTAEEVERLRARVAELEAQLESQARTTNALVAQSQEKLYWLERWQIDLEKVMGRRSAQLALEGLKAVREGLRAAKKLKRRMTGQV